MRMHVGFEYVCAPRPSLAALTGGNGGTRNDDLLKIVSKLCKGFESFFYSNESRFKQPTKPV